MACGTLTYTAYMAYSYTLFIYINSHKTVSYHQFTLSDTVKLFPIAYNAVPYTICCVGEKVPSILAPMGGWGAMSHSRCILGISRSFS